MAKKKKIEMKNVGPSLQNAFDDFLLARQGQGIAEKTVKTYTGHFNALKHYLDMSIPIDCLSTQELNAMIVAMREKGLATNSIASYVRFIRVFLRWCNEESLTDVMIPAYKEEETIKETYNDEELEALLKKPNVKKCKFNEYRDWVIINLLVNNGCRAASIRNIQIRDVDFQNTIISLRHNKSKRVHILPMSSPLVPILKEYMRIRGGDSPTDYLFPNECGEQMTESGLRCSIADYNRRRGVSKTSIHLFRNTFARKYLLECGGNAFSLQKLLGHATLEMTKKYCAIFNADLTESYDDFSPLAKMSSKKGRKIKVS